MVIVNIKGGLGNQMFCYAFAKALSIELDDIKIDNFSFFKKSKIHGGYQLDKLNIIINSATIEQIKLLRGSNFFNKKVNIIKHKHLVIPYLNFNENLLKLKGDLYLDGYFQSEKYFSNIRSELIKDFKVKNQITESAQKIKQQINRAKKTCSIHIRRGDYLDQKNSSIYTLVDVNYYNNAIKIITEKEPETCFFIFSDDIEWVKKNVKPINCFYIEKNSERNPCEDMHLMSLCKNNIISNSTFGWWGAWLNQNQNKKIIIPKRWFFDEKLNIQIRGLLCENWIKL